MTAEIETLTRPRTLAAARQTWKRRNRLLLSVARALADVVVMNAAFAVAWWARYMLGVGPDVAEQNFVDLGTYYPIMVGLTITLLVVYSFNGLYRQRLGASWLDEVGSIAVGTTVVRALESAPVGSGGIGPAEGWTHLFISPDRPPRVVRGLVTGLHAPRSTHLAMLAAFVPPELVRAAYADALRVGYRWHEFGDLCLIL